MAPTVWTIGYENLRPESLAAELEAILARGNRAPSALEIESPYALVSVRVPA